MRKQTSETLANHHVVFELYRKRERTMHGEVLSIHTPRARGTLYRDGKPVREFDVTLHGYDFINYRPRRCTFAVTADRITSWYRTRLNEPIKEE